MKSNKRWKYKWINTNKFWSLNAYWKGLQAVNYFCKAVHNKIVPSKTRSCKIFGVKKPLLKSKDIETAEALVAWY